MGKSWNLSETIPDSGRHCDEKDWAKAIQHGDKDAFRKMFEAYYNPLLRFGFRYVNSSAIAEGIVQDLFLWIWENRKGWNVEGKLKTYLFRAVKHRAIDYWRRERTKERYMEQYSEMQETYADLEISFEQEENNFTRAVRQAIEELPERVRLVYKLSRLEGLTYREIASVLEISPKTVESHMSKALDHLRKRLSEYLPVFSVLEIVMQVL